MSMTILKNEQVQLLDSKALNDYIEQLNQRKAELDKKEELSEDEMEESEAIEESIKACDKAKEILLLEEQARIAEEEAKKYKVAEGTENMYHLRIVKGQRFDSNSGEELSSPYIQRFTRSEAENFVANYKSLGYKILEIIYQPTELFTDKHLSK